MSKESPKKRAKTAENTSFFKDLLARRVPQIIGVYLASSWGLVQFVDWLVKRYGMSPFLTDVVLVALLSMLPTVAIVTYYHGKPGRDKWTRAEKVCLPVNLIVTVVLLVVMFSGKELGATSATIVVEDETGTKIERMVPKRAFRKRIALFYLENKTDKTDLDWLSYGVNELVAFDLLQDIFIDVWDGQNLNSRVASAGIERGVSVPLALRRKICNELHIDHFIAGEINKSGANYEVTLSLYKTQGGKPVSKKVFAGPDLFDLADEISIQLKRDLDIPENHLQKLNDLPVAEMLTHSEAALRWFITASNATFYDNDYVAAREPLERAVSEDPLFALAHFYLYDVYMNIGLSELAEPPLQTAMQHLYRLPEKSQLAIKSVYYFHHEEIDKQFALFKMQVELYPDDVDARVSLGNAHFRRNQFDDALIQYKAAYDLDPEKHFLLQSIGAIHFRNGEYDESLEYYNLYAEQYPNEARSFRGLGSVYGTLGQYDQAKSNYERAHLIDPNDVWTIIAMGNLDSRLGDFSAAEKLYDKALEISKTDEQRGDAYQALSDYFEKRGMSKKAFDYLLLSTEQRSRHRSPINHLIDDILFDLGRYVALGQTNTALEALARAEEQLPEQLQRLLILGEININLELGKADEAERNLKELERLMEIYEREDMRYFLHYAQGQIHEINGAYDKAIESYKQQLALLPLRPSIKVSLGRCYRQMGELDQAEDYLKQTIAFVPTTPKAHYEMALVQKQKGNQAEALNHIKTALEIWQNADADYAPARTARELLAAWQ